MILQTVNKLGTKNHFLYINYVINYGNLLIKNPKRNIVGINTYAKFE